MSPVGDPTSGFSTESGESSESILDAWRRHQLRMAQQALDVGSQSGTGGAPQFDLPTDVLGIGQFGAPVPTTQSISRSEFMDFSPTDMDILISFLKAGVQTPTGDFQAINPEDYFVELARGFVPTLTPQRTQFRF